jgi:hypothetical protein
MHNQQQPNLPEDEYYPVLSVGLGDVAPDGCEAADRDEEDQERLAFARRMSPYEWRHLAAIMGEILFDGDAWNNALDYAFDRLMDYDGAAEDGHDPEGARPEPMAGSCCFWSAAPESTEDKDE